MLRIELAKAVAEIAERPLTTVENNLIPKLNAAGLLPSLRGQGEVDASYRVNVLLGAILNIAYGASVGDAVRRLRALPLTGAADDLARTFGIKTTNAGDALDSILETVTTWPARIAKSPILEAKGDIHVAAEFHGEQDYMALVFHRGLKSVGQITFGTYPAADEVGRVERIVRLLHPAFLHLAV
jgi:hypothetical protein